MIELLNNLMPLYSRWSFFFLPLLGYLLLLSIFCFRFSFFVASRSWEHTYGTMESLGHICWWTKTIWACYLLNFFFHWWGCKARVPCSRCHWAGDLFVCLFLFSFFPNIFVFFWWLIMIRRYVACITLLVFLMVFNFLCC